MEDEMLKLNYINRHENPTYHVELHTHDMWEIIYYTEGTGIAEINNRKVAFEPHDIFVIPPGIPHRDYSNVGFKSYYYTFSDFEFKPISYFKFRDSDNLDFLHILEQIYREYQMKRNNWRNIVNSLYEVLFHYIVSFAQSPAQNKYVAHALQEIGDNVANPKFSIDQLIDEIPLNTDYFRKLFLHHTGRTPLQYLTFKRISYAQQLLISKKVSKLSIKEIAWKCGYEDYYYFSRVFKKEVGVSPREWLAQWNRDSNLPEHRPKQPYLQSSNKTIAN